MISSLNGILSVQPNIIIYGLSVVHQVSQTCIGILHPATPHLQKPPAPFSSILLILHESRTMEELIFPYLTSCYGFNVSFTSWGILTSAVETEGWKAYWEMMKSWGFTQVWGELIWVLFALFPVPLPVSCFLWWHRTQGTTLTQRERERASFTRPSFWTFGPLLNMHCLLLSSLVAPHKRIEYFSLLSKDSF